MKTNFRPNLGLWAGRLIIVTALWSGMASAQNMSPPDEKPMSESDDAPAESSTASPPVKTDAAVNETDSDASSEAAGEDAEREARLLKSALKRLEKEPTLDALIAAALKQANADVESVRSWQRRVRLSPMLPTVKVSVGYDLERDESLDRTQEDPDRWGADTDRDLAMQLTAQWEFDKLIFHPDELKIYNALADRAERREAVITMIIAYWFERRQLQLTLAVRPPKDVTEKNRITLRMKELGACIDALTGGALTRNLYGSVQTDATP